jgi:tetratricopeptide (TPR) repeat protein
MKRFIVNILLIVILSVGLGVGRGVAGAAVAATGGVVGAGASAVVADDVTDVMPAPAALTRDNDALWEEANAAYYANDFASASALYDSIERSGMVSAKLYYNKAGALFKMGKLGESILYYNKAQRLAPADADIAHNLAVANSYTRNRIEPVPEFFLKRWMGSVEAIMGGDGWAWLSVALFACVLAGALLYFLPLGHRTRKTGFYGSLAALLLLIFAFSFARRDRNETLHPSGGIVTSASAAVKSSPDNSGKDLFLLYEGDRVRVLDAMNGWNEITVVNSNRGWIRSSALTMID